MVLGKIAENTQNDRRIMDGNELCVILRSKNLNRDPGRRASRGLLKWRDVHGALPNIGAPKKKQKEKYRKNKREEEREKKKPKRNKNKKEVGNPRKKRLEKGERKKRNLQSDC